MNTTHALGGGSFLCLGVLVGDPLGPDLRTADYIHLRVYPDPRLHTSVSAVLALSHQ